MDRREDGFSGDLGGLQRIISLAGGAAMLFWAFARPGRRNTRRILGGIYMIIRGVAGRDPVVGLLGIARRRRGRQPIEVEEAVTIEKPREEVYAFWRNFENLPKVMSHLEEVRVIDADRSHWKARAPLNTDVEWDSELTVDRPNERISWRSLPDSEIPTEGTVRFASAPAGFGTEVHVHLQYAPPLGRLGATVARLFGEEPGQQIRDDLRRLKQLLETGQIPSVHGQTSARIGEVRREREEGGLAGGSYVEAARPRGGRRNGARRANRRDQETNG